MSAADGQRLEHLDKTTILASMQPELRQVLSSLSIEATLDSTNSALQRLPVVDQHAVVILAEHQSEGRGRRGRQWHSPFGKNLYLSLGWTFDKPLPELACLSLVLALATAQALARAGLKEHWIKWPNDILLDGRKLGGCLVEVQGDAHGPCYAVLGVGINVQMPATEAAAGIDQPWTDLHSQLPGYSRNALTALLLEEMISQLGLFATQGFAPFSAFWKKMDGLNGQTIEVSSGSGVLRGTARGIDDHGALILDTGKEVLILHAGEVSLHKSKGI